MAAEDVDLGGGDGGSGEIEESGDHYDDPAGVAGFNPGGGNEEGTAELHHQALVSDAKSSEFEKDDGIDSASTSTSVAVEVQRAEMNKPAVTTKTSDLAEAALFTAVNPSLTAHATTSEQSELLARIADLEVKIADLEMPDASIANLGARICDVEKLGVTIRELEARIAPIENMEIELLPDLEAKIAAIENMLVYVGASIGNLEAKITAIKVKLRKATESRAKIGSQKKSYNNITGGPWAVTAMVALLSAVSAFAVYYLRTKRHIGK